jgi:DNA-binding response OmpR family regulator
VGNILAVEDNPVNLKILVKTLVTQGYSVTTAANGLEAMSALSAGDPRAFDVVLLDILMPEMNGYETLRAIKSDSALRDLPVLMISAIDEMASVIECIKMGAIDYLMKPFNADLLRARIESSMATKRLRDLELEYLEQVQKLTNAAIEVESGTYEPSSLENVAGRKDELGRLARVFQQMVREVRAREERLTQQVRELRIEIDEARQDRQVTEITESEFYQKISAEADALRQIIAELQ